MDAPVRHHLVVLMIGSVFAVGCVQRERLNSDCKWTGDPTVPLDLADSAQRRHLDQDLVHAEELAVRYGDARPRPRRPLREQCIASLAETISRSHRVPVSDVLAARGRRDERWDAGVAILFAAFYAFASHRLIRWNVPRYADGRVAAIISVLALSLVASAIGVLVGNLWAHLMESARFGWTGHISERGFRIPWRHHFGEIFVAGVLLFWLVAIVDGMMTRSIAKCP